jgi:serine/threonine-protein phosphatase 5
VFDHFDVNNIKEEDDYTDPTFNFTEASHNITLDFVTNLIEHYKQQKTLHRKYALKILIEKYTFVKSQPSLIDIHVNDGDKFTVCGTFFFNFRKKRNFNDF